MDNTDDMLEEEVLQLTWKDGEDEPLHDKEKYRPVCTAWCPWNCELPDDAPQCSKGMQHLGHFESLAKAHLRMCNHSAGKCHQKGEVATKQRIEEVAQSCVQWSFWRTDDWKQYCQQTKDNVRAANERAKESRAAAQASAASRDGPYVKGPPQQPGHAPPAHVGVRPPSSRPPPAPSVGPRLQSLQTQAGPDVHPLHPSQYGPQRRMSQLADSVNSAHPLQLGNLQGPPPMSSKSVLLEHLTKAEAGLRASSRIAKFCALAYEEEADKLGEAKLV